MSEAVTHQLMMLRPMQAGLNGFARLQGEAGRQLVQINLRGMQPGEMRVFWYAGEGLVRELGRSSANQRGEASLNADVPMDAAAPRRLMALLVTNGDKQPRPLAIGLCTAQSAGSLMDAKNALLALCERLGREAQKEEEARHAARKAQEAGCATSCGACAEPTNLTPQRMQASAASAEGARCAAPSLKDALVVNVATNACAACTADGAHGAKGTSHCNEQANPMTLSQLHSEASSASPEAANSATVSITHRQPGSKRSHGAHPSRPSQNQPEAPLPREVFLPAIEAKSRPERRRMRRSTSARPQASVTKEASAHLAPEGPDVVPKAAKPDQSSPKAAPSTPAEGAVSPPSPPSCRTATQYPTGQHPATEPADLLPVLEWPPPFQQLSDYFDRYRPQRLMNWPGWRFVHVPQGKDGLWIGYTQQNDRITQVAYALSAHAPLPDGQPFRPTKTATGETVQMLLLQT